jgi:hypothetical protein
VRGEEWQVEEDGQKFERVEREERGCEGKFNIAHFTDAANYKKKVATNTSLCDLNRELKIPFSAFSCLLLDDDHDASYTK